MPTRYRYGPSWNQAVVLNKHEGESAKKQDAVSALCDDIVFHEQNLKISDGTGNFKNAMEVSRERQSAHSPEQRDADFDAIGSFKEKFGSMNSTPITSDYFDMPSFSMQDIESDCCDPPKDGSFNAVQGSTGNTDESQDSQDDHPSDDLSTMSS